jgi:hypothetical protein
MLHWVYEMKRLKKLVMADADEDQGPRWRCITSIYIHVGPLLRDVSWGAVSTACGYSNLFMVFLLAASP